MHDPKLAVIIVSYNVKYFLEQCLLSVETASKGIPTEVYVVDNNSVDGSGSMVRTRFPEVCLIENKQNLGFSKANNLAIALCKAEYVLLLNPDTLVEENTFIKILDFIDSRPEAGALGVKMIDGKGKFLPESKRGLPTPTAAFFKMIGLSKLFPNSRTFGHYHLSYLKQDETHEVEILSGAFMLVRKSILDRIGGLDERFFMYGEDIDLSYRILLAGYKNYYFSGTTIIHYKGESTKKSSLNYVKIFYQAMILFADKHFTGSHSRYFIFLIQLAVYLSAIAFVVRKALGVLLQPLLDLTLATYIYFLFTSYWETHKFGPGGQFPDYTQYTLLPLLICMHIYTTYITGGYKNRCDLTKLIKGSSILLLVQLAIYSILPEEVRFSRFVVIAGSLATSSLIVAIRLVSQWRKQKRIDFDLTPQYRVAVVGSQAEAIRIEDIMRKSGIKHQMLGAICETNKNCTNPSTIEILGEIDQLNEICKLNKINEIIFSSKDLSSETIIHQMHKLSNMSILFKIAANESHYIIGSNSTHTSGQIYLMEFSSISKESNRRIKRLLDVVLCTAFLIILPIRVFFKNENLFLLVYCTKVLLNNYTWVGYDRRIGDDKLERLPSIKKGVFQITDRQESDLDEQSIDQLNTHYARNYSIWDDVNVALSHFLGSLKMSEKNLSNSKNKNDRYEK